jgi:hypothetical protein
MYPQVQADAESRLRRCTLDSEALMDIAKNDHQPYRQASTGATFRLITVRLPRELVDRIDNGSKRPGARRQAFIVESIVEKLQKSGC